MDCEHAVLDCKPLHVGAWRLATVARGRHDGLPSPEQPPPMPDWVVAWLQVNVPLVNSYG